MKRIAYLFLLSLCFGFFNLTHAQSSIAWSKDYQLKWSDFQAEPDLEIIAYANTVYKIEILPTNVAVDAQNNIQNYQAITATAFFFKNLSWVYKEDDSLLVHEQLHFDIAELHARKIRTEFEKLKKQKIANFNSYSAAYARVWEACLQMQRLYDQETNHGIIVEENKRWEKKISKLLDEAE